MLADLAKAMGVATEYDDWRGGNVIVPASTIVAVLRALGIDASDDAAAARALAQEADRPWRRLLPPVVVCREGWTPWVPVHLPHGEQAEVWVELEDGGRRDVRQVDHWVPPRVIDGREVGEATYELPGDLPLGWHTLVASQGRTTATAPLIVTPAWLRLPPALAGRRACGLMTQLYSVRSRRSWGVGDLADLGDLASWAARDLGRGLRPGQPAARGRAGAADGAVALPADDAAVRQPAVPAGRANPRARLRLGGRAASCWSGTRTTRAPLDTDDVIDRDAVLAAPSAAALRIVFQLPRSARPRARVRRVRRARGAGRSVDFATWCALAQKHGPPLGRVARRSCTTPQSPRWAAARERPRRGRATSTAGCSGSLDEQLGTRAAGQPGHAGMALGVMHDLAVGVHPDGADAWALQDVLALGVTVGAPPDAFNQIGQDW